MIKIDEQSWKNELRVGDKVRVHWEKQFLKEQSSPKRDGE